VASRTAGDTQCCVVSPSTPKPSLGVGATHMQDMGRPMCLEHSPLHKGGTAAAGLGAACYKVCSNYHALAIGACLHVQQCGAFSEETRTPS